MLFWVLYFFLLKKLPPNFMAENDTYFIRARDSSQVQPGDSSVAGDIDRGPWVAFSRWMAGFGGLNLACPGPQWGWLGGGWFHRNGHLELLHVASPAWQFTSMNLKVIRDLTLWLGAPREGCSSE